MLTTSVEKELMSVSDTAIASARPLAGIELDDTQNAMLLSIARKHCKLALEHSQTATTLQRRQHIRDEIQSLRAMREDLFAEWRKDAKNL